MDFVQDQMNVAQSEMIDLEIDACMRIRTIALWKKERKILKKIY